MFNFFYKIDDFSLNILFFRKKYIILHIKIVQWVDKKII